MTQRRRQRAGRGRAEVGRPRPSGRRQQSQPSLSPRPPTRLRVSGAGDFVELTPYLLGFHPVESLVMMFICDGRVELTARADLSGGVESLRVIIRRAARRCRAQVLFLAAYSASPCVEDTLLALVEDPALPGIVDAVRVEGNRWWSVLDHDHGDVPGTGRLAAEAVFAGLTVAPTRQDAVAAAAPPLPTDLAGLLEQAGRQRVAVAALPSQARVEEAVSTVGRRLDDPGPWSRAQRLRLAVLVEHDIAARDAVLLRTTRDNADAAVRLWSQVVGCAPPGYEVAALCLLGLAAWQSGNGALMVECVNRAGAADPDCTLVGLLGQIIDAAVPPEAWGGVATKMRMSEHR